MLKNIAFICCIVVVVIAIALLFNIATQVPETETVYEFELSMPEILSIKWEPPEVAVPDPESEPEYIQVFIYYSDIPLDPGLQEHTYTMAEKYSIPFDILLAIMWHESRYIPDVPDNINTNGTRDRGLMQINSVHWEWLSEGGLDVSDPYCNIEAGAMLLSELWQKYSQREALAAYAAGEAGMLTGRGYWFADKIMEIAEVR